MLWQGNIENHQTIPLYQLSYGDIFQVIQHIFQGIKDEKYSQAIATLGKEESKRRQNNLLPHAHKPIIIHRGEKVVTIGNGAHYEVSGQAGAVGRNANT
ncbi:hypothetical protein [Trichormus azollae]|jgi:hypothetical protein|uniref:Uncharacterized protein n=1 Tax=Nostoc azollae (strain 0708) TaxID=551115 RepID=D7E5B7_NOSA0|nr:hypothetical protein [Trichormus azollae]ADI65477.1 hypothetical protein Aazo_3989 ['Nostoc azollae' 0708]